MWLFVPYFRSSSDARQAELDECIRQNVACGQFDRIVLLIDDDATPPIESDLLTIERVPRRPTYADWVRRSYDAPKGTVSVLANADIFFDRSASVLKELLDRDPTGFVALSRYEREQHGDVLHPNPHWSQDVWAFLPHAACNPGRDIFLDFPLGVPRCDNKVAYTFAVYGHLVYNPCHDVKTIHLHQTGLRGYSKTGDRTILGGMAMVHASKSAFEPALLDIELWPTTKQQFKSVKVSGMIEKWDAELRQSTHTTQDRSGVPPLLVYDDHWQFPAITEEHAYRRVSENGLSRATYVGFPWATLIDLLKHNAKDTRRLDTLNRELANIRAQVPKGCPVVTVCQHIRMLEFMDIFERSGITDIFWSHATVGLNQAPGTGINLHSFPLYPVQTVDQQKEFYQRKYLYSFVGAKAGKGYLSDVRSHIIEALGSRPEALVVERTQWHYNRVVYDGQVFGKLDKEAQAVDDRASEEFKKVMADTQFSLCPSGTGPNSIRLWESFASGSIPVVLAGNYRPPNAGRLWKLAVIECDEDLASVRELPARLEAVRRQPALVQRMLDAGLLLSQRYGVGDFIFDIKAQFG